ncbi:unnamed protein product, partial [Soboliphyme baturini]|uniref:Beta-1,3-galactosyl-O-glycosyl-glycoprotein beta-1,6-N-acetylglucosaminyltransferase 3-like n=1 Tax=Soboliphyme baturini TaxID=241478 RepID=A0A183JA21_9BILA
IHSRLLAGLAFRFYDDFDRITCFQTSSGNISYFLVTTDIKSLSLKFCLLSGVTLSAAVLLFWSHIQHQHRIFSSHRAEPFFIKQHPFRCDQIFAGDNHQISIAMQQSRTLLTDYEVYKLLANCSALFSRHFYPLIPTSEEEEKFPLAYVILINEHLEQVEILLNAIYAPQNIYCIHVDLKAPYIVHAAMQRLSRCLPNVMVSKTSFPISRVFIEMLDACLSCIEDIYTYLLTLQGHDFPLKTNREIVKILRAHRGANDVELVPPHDHIRYIWKYVFDESGIPIDIVQTNFIRGPPPKNIILYKGNFAVSLSRQFVDEIRMHELRSLLLKYLRNSASGDEIFWSSLNHNDWLNFSGNYPGRCVSSGRKTWISRFTLWKHEDGSTADLRHVVCRPHLFLNKFWLPDDPVAVDCLHELLFKRNYLYDKTGVLNLTYYDNLPGVLYQKHRLTPVISLQLWCGYRITA